MGVDPVPFGELPQVFRSSNGDPVELPVPSTRQCLDDTGVLESGDGAVETPRTEGDPSERFNVLDQGVAVLRSGRKADENQRTSIGRPPDDCHPAMIPKPVVAARWSRRARSGPSTGSPVTPPIRRGSAGVRAEVTVVRSLRASSSYTAWRGTWSTPRYPASRSASHSSGNSDESSLIPAGDRSTDPTNPGHATRRGGRATTDGGRSGGERPAGPIVLSLYIVPDLRFCGGASKNRTCDLSIISAAL